MPKKARQQRKPKRLQHKGRSRRKALIAIALFLSLSIAGMIVAQWRGTPAISTHLASAPLTPPSPTSTTPLLSKEYIYAGGRLVATEEPISQTEDVVWTNVVGATATGNDLTKTAAAAWGNSGAISTKGIVMGDGYVEFTASEANAVRMCGLSDGDTTQSYPDIKFAIYPHSSGNIYVYESGVSRGIVGSYAAGDKLRVSVENNQIKYWKIQQETLTLLYTSNLTPAYPLLVDAALHTTNSTITDAVISGNLTRVLTDGTSVQEVAWTNVVGATASGNNLTKTVTYGWTNSGASSTQFLTSGDGFVEFTTNESNAAKMCGLNVGDNNQSYTEINFALYPGNTGNIYIYESGVARSVNGSTIFGTYVAGDHFRVSVENNQVKYWKISQGTATLLYTSAVAPSYPLLVDTSLYNTGATVNDVVVAGFAP